MFGDIFIAIRIIGGIYLVYLGIKMSEAAVSSHNQKQTGKKINGRHLFSGFLLTLGNPKPILFYASVCSPQLSIFKK